MNLPSARVSRSGVTLLFYVFLIASLVWIIRHIASIIGIYHTPSIFAPIWIVSFLALSWGMIFSTLEKPKKLKYMRQYLDLMNLKVTVLIPAYNEDPELLKLCVVSLLLQTRKPNVIHVTDDGSTNSDYSEVKGQLAKLCGKRDVELTWVRTENLGKRNAQAVGIRMHKDSDIFITVDSDTTLDKNAIFEGLKPFVDKKIMAVAGVYLPLNVSSNLLTRISSVWEVSWQLIDRSSQSFFSSVMVNSGVLAFYRSEPILKNLDSYLNETFFGREVKFSDDSLLTMYALLDGKTIQQPTAFAFSATPEKVSHHIRRYVRWMRGSFIRSWWRFKYLPIKSYAYWWHLAKWTQLLTSTIVTIYLILMGVYTNTNAIWYFVLFGIVLSYAQALKYLTVIRSDEKVWSQLLTFSLAPLATLWAMTILRVVRNYAYLTCYKTGWGTRKKVEVVA